MVKKALLIGINYKGTDAELRGCINDIKNIKSILIDNCNYTIENIKVLTEESEILPTKNNIENEINWLVSNCMPGDQLLFYYSGHGYNLPDESKDESDEKDEVLIPLDYEENGIITDDWLYTNLACKVPIGVKLFGFTDCCHSGTMIDLKYNYKSLCKYKKGEIKKKDYVFSEWTDSFALEIEKSKETDGYVCFFSGCQDPQVAADAHIGKQFQGAFTYCLIEFMKTNLQRMSNGTFRFKNGNVKLRNVLKEINARLDLNGFTGQDSQLSISNETSLNLTFDL